MKLVDWFEKKKQDKLFIGMVLLLILTAGFFVRAYNHESWLLFQSDQARDATIISRAIEEGFEKMPLVGPQARSSDLHLGPFFYYPGYVLGKVFGDHPNVFAWPDLFFSVGAIFIFFVFARKYFSFWLSVGLMLLFAGSAFLISYGRFAWNPNSLPFFMLLMSLGLINSTEKSGKSKYFWFGIAVFSLAVATQLHFVAFFVAPGIFLIYTIANRKSIKKTMMVMLVLIPLIYSPVILYEFKTDYQNSKAFVGTFGDKTTKDSKKHGLGQKVFKSFQETSRYSWLVISGDQKTDTFQIKKRKNGTLKLSCDKKCDQFKTHSLFAMIFFLVSIFLLLGEKMNCLDKKKNNFLFLVMSWGLLFFITITPIAYQGSPRFYLVFAPVSFILLGIVLKHIIKLGKAKKSRVIVVLILFSLLLTNLNEVKKYFNELRVAESGKDVPSRRDIIMPGGETVTLKQQKTIANSIKNNNLAKSSWPFTVVVENQYARPIYYLLDKYHETSVKCYLKMSEFEPEQLDSYIYIVTTDSKEHISKEILQLYNVVSGKKIGTLTFYELFPKKPFEKDSVPPGCRGF